MTLVAPYLYSSIPLTWWLAGSQLWLIYVVVGIGACLGMVFQVTYVTAVANLVDTDQIIDANSRLQMTYSIAFVAGPVLAGFIAGILGPTAAVAFDALSFMISALSVILIRLRPVAQIMPDALARHESATGVDPKPKPASIWSGLLTGLQFIWQEPVLRPVMFLLACFTLATAGALDLFIFHLKHDLGANDNIVGIVFGLASIGGLVGGLLAPALRRRLGFGPCWLGGFILNSLSLILLAIAPSLILCCVLAMLFTFTSTISSVVSLSLRQEITPDHLLGRVTAVFWTAIGMPGPIGAAIFTTMSAHIGATAVLEIVGAFCLIIAVFGLLTPARRRFPERGQQVV